MDYSKCKNDELKRILKELDLSTGGNKSTLISRIKAYENNEPINKNIVNIIIDENNIRHRIDSAGVKRKVCNFKDSVTQEYCTNYAKNKTEYCKRHKNGVEKEIIKKEPIILEDQEIRDKQKLTTEKGDNSELYILSIIQEFKEIKTCFKMGHLYGSYDIKYQFNDENIERGLQVKTLRKNVSDNHGWSADMGNYLDNTLIVMVNQERDKFGLIFSQNCPIKTLSMSYKSNTKSKYKNNTFIDINKFKEQLLKDMRSSVEYEEILSKNHIIEKENLERLEQKCEEYNLIYERSNSAASIYDCRINGFNIQCKFTADKNGYQYNCPVFKSGPNVKGKQQHIPYSEKDNIDFLIIEIDEAKNHFYIIPKFELVKRKIFSTDTEQGLRFIMVPPINYNGTGIKYIWLLNYLDRFDLLQLKLKIL